MSRFIKNAISKARNIYLGKYSAGSSTIESKIDKYADFLDDSSNIFEIISNKFRQSQGRFLKQLE